MNAEEREVTKVHYSSYMEGLKEAWKLAKLIASTPKQVLKAIGFDAPDDDEFSCSVIERYDILDVVCKFSQEELHVGDEVINKNRDIRFFVTNVYDMSNINYSKFIDPNCYDYNSIKTGCNINYSTFIDGVSLTGKVYEKEDLANWLRTGKTVSDYKKEILKDLRARILELNDIKNK